MSKQEGGGCDCGAIDTHGAISEASKFPKNGKIGKMAKWKNRQGRQKMVKPVIGLKMAKREARRGKSVIAQFPILIDFATIPA